MTAQIPATKTKSSVEQRVRRDEAAHAQITRAADYREQTGKCPVCRTRNGGHGITCGRIECIAKWLNIKIGEGD